jgi:hypothetical protein
MFITACFFFAVLSFTNEKFRNRVSELLPFSNKNKKDGAPQIPFALVIIIIVACVVLAYFF